LKIRYKYIGFADLNPLVEGSNPSWPTNKFKVLAVFLVENTRYFRPGFRPKSAVFTCGWRIANTIRHHKQLAGLITVAISPALTPMRDLLMKQQLLVLSRTRRRAPPISATDRVLFGLRALFLGPQRPVVNPEEICAN